MKYDIDFAALGGPTYTGRPDGERARAQLKIDEREDEPDVEFHVDIPISTYNINSSYFLGLFGNSIRKAGTRDKFLDKFQFETHGKEHKVIDRGIQRALLSGNGLPIV